MTRCNSALVLILKLELLGEVNNDLGVDWDGVVGVNAKRVITLRLKICGGGVQISHVHLAGRRARGNRCGSTRKLQNIASFPGYYVQGE